VLVGILEKLDYAWALKVCGATASTVEVAAHGAGDAIFIYLADVHEEVTVLSAAVIPLLKNFGNLWVMSSEASRAKEPKASGVA
jgi:hypothetical protein